MQRSQQPERCQKDNERIILKRCQKGLKQQVAADQCAIQVNA